MPGAGTRNAAETPSERHLCSICLELLCRPVQPPCGHIYCQHCIRRAALAQERSGHVVTCPLCRAAFAPSAAVSNADIEQEIGRRYAAEAARRLAATEKEAQSVAAAWKQRHAACTWRQLAVIVLLGASLVAVMDFTLLPPPTFPRSSKAFVENLDARQRRQLQSSRPTLAAEIGATAWCKLRVLEGGVWWSQPEVAPQQWVTLGQLTVPAQSVWRLTINLQGRRPLWISDGTTIGTGCQKCTGPDEDWVERGVVFSSDARDNSRAYLHVVPVVRRVAVNGIAGHDTVRLEVTLKPSALNVYKLFGDEEYPLVFEGQIFEFAQPLPSARGALAVEQLSEQQLAHSWDSFLSVGITDSVTADDSGSGWLGSTSELESYGLDSCLGTPQPQPQPNRRVV